MHHRALAASLVVLPLVFGLGVAPAIAQVGDTPEVLRDKARAALAAGDKAAACLLFGQSYLAAVSAKAAGTAGPDPGEVLFDLADCHEKQGVAALAASEYEQVAEGAGPKSAEAKARAAALRAPAPPPPAVPASPPLQPRPVALPVVPPPPVRPEPPKTEESPVRVGDFMDTRLSWTLGDDDVLQQTGLVTPFSPNLTIGDRKQYRLFFDNLNSRFSGRENLTHLALYKKMPGYLPRFDTEASLVIRFDLDNLASKDPDLKRAIYDSGSFIRLFYHTTGDKNGKTGIGLTLWPLDTDRFRLGYLYDISWGGTNARINQSIFPRIQGSSPGAKLQFDAKNASVFLGFKTASIVQVEQILTPGTSEVEEVRIVQTNLGVLGGGGIDIGDYVHADLGGGFFQQGKFDLPDVRFERIYTFGGSARFIVHHKDMPVPQSIDLTLYRNDPDKPQIIFKPETYTPGKTTWSVSVEGSLLGQHLKDFDAAGATAIQPAVAAALQANIKSGYLRGSLTGIFRDVPFLLRNQPSYIPFQTLPADAITKNEFFLAAAVDYAIKSIRLTPGIGAGLQFPATFNTISVNSASAPINRTVVIREQGSYAILPVNQNAVPIFQMRASLKWDLSKILSAIAWIQYTRDNNGSFLERDPNEGTVFLRTFNSPNFLGLGTSVQARF